VTGTVNGTFAGGQTPTNLTGTITVSSDARTITGYYADNSGSNTALTKSGTVAYGTSEAAATAGLSTTGYAKLSDDSYVPITITWAFDSSYDGTVTGSKAVTGTVNGTFAGGQTPTNLTGTVTVSLNTAKAITAFALGSSTGTINQTNHTIAITVPYGTDVTSLVAMFTTTGSSVDVLSTTQVSGTTANDFTTPVTYTVTAADLSTQDYIVTVTVRSAPSSGGGSSGGSSSGGTSTPAAPVTINGGNTDTTGTANPSTTATITASNTNTSTITNVTVTLPAVTVTAPASVLSSALGDDDSAWLKLSQDPTATATQTSVNTVAEASGVTPVTTLDVDLTRYYSNGTSEPVHQLSGNITVTINLTAAQIALITNPSSAQLLYFDPTTGTLTNMNAVFNLTAGTATFQTNHFSTFVIATGSTSTPTGSKVGVSYDDHMQTFAWQPYVNDGKQAGNTVKGLRLEAVNVKLTGDVPTGASITYQAHVQSKGWQAPVSDGLTAGTTGKALRLEALKITLSGMTGYEVKYRVYVQGKGWMAWQITKNGTAINDAGVAGTTGKALKAEAVEIIVEKSAV
jgi:hypothetical protein